MLNLASGTGWTSRIVARRGASVVGADIADGLLEAAREGAAAEGLEIDYRVGDAAHLPFADGQFDAVISSVGVVSASRSEVAATELARVCRRGGRVALATWLPDSNVFQCATSRQQRWMAAGVTDMRCGIDSLAVKVQTVLAEDPYAGHLFAFRGRVALSAAQLSMLLEGIGTQELPAPGVRTPGATAPA